MAKPEICIVVCTYERPENLRRVLASIAGQRDVGGKLELVVADDGSRDATAEIVERFRQQADFPVRFVTHEHRGFCPSRCRNEGVAASEADYLLLLDGDCMIPPDHVRIHLDRRRVGVVRTGDCLRLSEEVSAGVSEELARAGKFPALATWSQRSRIWRKACKGWWYSLRRHPVKPYLTSNNVGIWRDDYFRINGFDENYVGWGCEDDDFGVRLRRSGLRLESILWWTNPYHLWHSTDPSMPDRWNQGPNVAYFKRGFHLVRCGNGVEKRAPWDVALQLVGEAPRSSVLNRIFPAWCHLAPRNPQQPAEVEVLFAPSGHSFSGRADCNLLIVAEQNSQFLPHYAQAHLVLADHPWLHIHRDCQFGLHELEGALRYLLDNTPPAARARRVAA
jgi:glycosyltransferase involved in cell wall biosynthesis